MINRVTQLSIKEKVKLFNKLYDELASYGREGDTELAHINPFEAKLLRAVGGSGTINPVTGLREYKGGGSSPPPPASQTVRQETTIPDELKPFVTDILEESQAQYQQRSEEGYVPYEGAQIAQFTPEQQGTPLGQSTTYLAPALGATTASTLPTTAATIGQYMDPYLENVLRVQEQEARRADEISRQGRAAQAVQAGAFGGSREAVMESEAQRGLEDRLASLRATGMSQAFQTAQQMAEAQRARELAAGRQYAALGETAAQQQAREIGGLAATGEALRGQTQAGLDIAKTQFMEEEQFPQSQLQQYSSIIRGFPLTPSQLQTTQTVTPQPSLTQQLLGAGVGAAGLAGAFGAFGGRKEGGLVGLAEGGRPMDAMPMKPRRRAADLGAAIGSLAQRMSTGRSMSQIGGGLTSVLSAPAMSQNMQQMMPQQASATPMQMPSQRFMNAGGKVGYYQQEGMIPFSQEILQGTSLSAQTPPSGLPDLKAIEEETKRKREANEAKIAAARRLQEGEQRGIEMAKPTAEDTALMEMLKKRQTTLAGREGGIEEEAVEAKDLLDRQKYLTLLNVGAAIASPQGGTQGFIPDITKALASQTDKFSSLMDREADIAKEKSEKLGKLSDRQLDNMAKQRGISREALDREIKAEKLSLSADVKLAEANVAAAESEIAQRQAFRKEYREGQELEADLLTKQAARIKAQKPTEMKSGDYNALKGSVATRLQAVVDDLGNITLPGGRPLEEGQASEAVGLLKEAVTEYNRILKDGGTTGDAYAAATEVIEQRPTSDTSGSGAQSPAVKVIKGKAYSLQPDGSYKAADGTVLQ
jgi:hypothetical protein